MKKLNILLLGACAAALLFTQCKKETKQAEAAAPAISESVLAQIKDLGFSTSNVHQVEKGYVVEGDILLTPEFMQSTPGNNALVVGTSEQYRTKYIVSALPRTITIGTTGLGTAYIKGAQTAIARYNALNLRITFQYVTTPTANIMIKGFNEAPSGGYISLGSAGFPTSKGAPYSEILMNTNQYAYGGNPDTLFVASVIQHELGHCIGFRHTDYLDRSYSCSGAYSNEGAGKVGAILIPGTPSSADPDSWMLACSNRGDRTFNANDKIALDYLY